MISQVHKLWFYRLCFIFFHHDGVFYCWEKSEHKNVFTAKRKIFIFKYLWASLSLSWNSVKINYICSQSCFIFTLNKTFRFLGNKFLFLKINNNLHLVNYFLRVLSNFLHRFHCASIRNSFASYSRIQFG